MSSIRKAIIPVAGLGTRFLPATKAQPKEMLPIVDKPIIQYLVEEAVASGIKEVIFITGKGKRAIEDHFDEIPELEAHLLRNHKESLLTHIKSISTLAKFAYVRQSVPRGNGDAILQARHLIGSEPVAVLYGDDIVKSATPCLKQMIDIFDVHHQPVLALERVPRNDIHKYGAVKVKKISPRFYEIIDIVEKPKNISGFSDLAIVGKYIITNSVINKLARLPYPKTGEFLLTDGLRAYLASGGKMYGWEFEGKRYDCGSKMGFLQATVELALEHPEVQAEFKSYLKKLAKNL